MLPYFYVECLALVEVWLRVVDGIEARVHAGERVAGGDAVLDWDYPHAVTFVTIYQQNHLSDPLSDGILLHSHSWYHCQNR